MIGLIQKLVLQRVEEPQPYWQAIRLRIIGNQALFIQGFLRAWPMAMEALLEWLRIYSRQ